MRAHSRLAKMKEFDELEIVRPLRSPNRGILITLFSLLLFHLILSYLILSSFVLSCFCGYSMSGIVADNTILRQHLLTIISNTVFVCLQARTQ